MTEYQEPDSGTGHRLRELAHLARTAGLEVGGIARQRRVQVDPAFYVGEGKAHEIAQRVAKERHEAIVFDGDLSPRQARNLEQLCRVRVLDRSELILDIFAKHARTAQAQRQVELARLEYELPRLRRMWTHLSRIHGGGSGAARALRGPGEKQLEADRRQHRHRINDLRRELAALESRRQREIDHRSELFSVSLVGYTNAGKSTLLNALTGADAVVADQLFSTLDTLTRVWRLPHRRRVLLSDTVGFIDRLPHHLVSSFHATLAETCRADLLLHVVDASTARAEDEIRSVQAVLEAIGAHDRPTLVVLNKTDEVSDPVDLQILRQAVPDHVLVSARSGAGLVDLANRVEDLVERCDVEIVVRCAAGDGKLYALLEEHGRILNVDYANGEQATVRARLEPREEGKLRKHLAAAGGTYEVVSPRPIRESGAPDRP